MIVTGLLLAVLAACCYAVAATCQHDAVHAVAAGRGQLSLAQLASLFGNRRWLTGMLAVACGAAFHVVSLSFAPLVVVQPVGVLSIALTALFTARATGTRMSRATVRSVIAISAGIGLFVLVAAPHATASGVPELAAGRILPVTAVAVAVLVLAALSTRNWARCPLFATAAGVAYGTVSVLTRALAERIRVVGVTGLPLGPTVVAVLGAIVAIVTGAVCVQQAYAAGRPDTVMACQTVVDPLVGVLFGMLVFHEAIGSTPLAVLGEVTGGLLATSGVIRLARTTQPHRSRKQAMDRPLRIIIGADTFPPDINGAARFGHQLATGLAGRGHDVHVLCPSDTGPAGTTVVDGVTVHRLAAHRTPCHPTFRVCLPWQARRGAAELLDELEPDLVHTQAHFSVGRALVGAAAERDIPVVATNHFMPENLFGYLKVPAWLRAAAARLAWRDLGRVLRPAKVVTAPTPTAVAMLHRQGFDEALPVSCGVDLDRFAGDEPGDGRTVLFVGRLDEEKRVHELLRAAALLPDIRVELVGDGNCRAALSALAAGLGIADRVTFLGFVSDEDLVAAYRRCAVFCMPGVAELQSLATMEAMAAGRPVVAADAVALPHLVAPGHNGFLFPPGDVRALADRIATLFGQPGALATMGAASREMIAWHDVRSSLDTFEGLYRTALGRPVLELVETDRELLSIPAAAVRP
ncbi:MAG TPA: glycosyltransferase [Pseudonocardiaceae bacterium]|jgi:glycosyltransferase involved in cell wall biosynthesis|nr:glycosyltransferase [Pseudonocardiaceae bacterium]